LLLLHRNIRDKDQEGYSPACIDVVEGVVVLQMGPKNLLLWPQKKSLRVLERVVEEVA
jgi:hypothetical protein